MIFFLLTIPEIFYQMLSFIVTARRRYSAVTGNIYTGRPALTLLVVGTSIFSTKLNFPFFTVSKPNTTFSDCFSQICLASNVSVFDSLPTQHFQRSRTNREARFNQSVFYRQCEVIFWREGPHVARFCGVPENVHHLGL